MITAAELICRVCLQDGALTQSSLETLAAAGIDTCAQPRRTMSLPPRQRVATRDRWRIHEREQQWESDVGGVDSRIQVSLLPPRPATGLTGASSAAEYRDV